MSAAQPAAIAVYSEGPDAATARDAVIDAVAPGANVVDDQTFRKELIRQGQKKPFGKYIDSHAIERVRRAARAVGADAVLLVRVRKAQPRSAFVLRVELSGGVTADREIKFRARMKDEDRDELRRALHEAEPPPPATTPEAPPAAASSAEAGREQTPRAGPPSAEPSTSSPTPAAVTAGPPHDTAGGEAGPPVSAGRPVDARAVATSLADIAVDGELAARRFEYRNGIGSHVSILHPSAAPVVGIGGELFPLAASRGAWGDLGFVGHYWMMFSPGFGGINPSGYGAGLRVRIHPGVDPPVLLSLTVGYESSWFDAYDSSSSGGDRLPEVTYRAVRPAVDVRVPIGRFSILAGTGLRALLNPHDVSEQFYNPKGIGFDAHAGATFVVFSRFEARLIASYARYSFSLSPPAGATFGMGAATDQLYGGQLAVGYIF